MRLPTPDDAAPRRRSRGYTMVEVMMALAILAVGAVGIISLQKVTVMGGLNSRNLTSASDAASGWVNALQAEATLWNDASNADIADMPTISTALGSPGSWVDIPTAGPFPNGGATLAPDTADTLFCTQIRASFVGTAPTTGLGASDTIRLEVRTFFARDGHPINAECAGGLTAANVDTLLTTLPPMTAGTPVHSRADLGFVFVTSMVRRSTI